MKLIKKLVPYAIVIVLFGIAIGLGYKFRVPISEWLNPPTEPTIANVDEPIEVIDITYLEKKLEKIAELRTAKVSYGCIATFGNGKIPLINKKRVVVYYEAEAYAGVDVSEITCTQDENGKYIIQLPTASVYDNEINITKKNYVDQDKAVLNWTTLEDSDVIDAELKKDFKNQTMYYELLDMADENAVSVIKGLLIGIIEEEQFEIKTGTRESVNLVVPPFSSDDDIEKSCSEVAEEFEKAGFKNIKQNPVVKKSYDVFAKNGKVEEITINGKSIFAADETFREDAEVIITYQKKA